MAGILQRGAKSLVFFFFFAFRVLIFTNMLIMRRMNIMFFNIILKGQKPKLIM